MKSCEIDRLFLFKELRDVWGIPFTKQHLKRLEDKGRFPKRVHLNGSGRVAWLASDLRDWVTKRAASRFDLRPKHE